MSKKSKQVEVRVREQLGSHVSQQEVILLERRSILPPPNELERYEALCPGITERFLSSYEKQQNHRMELEKKAVFTGVKQALRGQVFAFILGAVTIAGGIYLIIKDKNVQGYTLIIGSAATLAGVFMYGKHQNKKERIEKARLNPERG